ncbi:hypothetical protein [Polluticaenibacter yanchengensis]|uniref:Uncharacterized protein n=1 Tax=Polluticaenibacter yanchengensis TaxID=3014562 RepID=A0ABT4UIS7_9BACT|nr:hypothetical protein [Chitinophagaceae bacterium LY-5]
MSKRLEILKQSLIKKEAQLSNRISAHFDTVKQANGQPLNDKRNGRATLNKWEKQNDAIRNLMTSIDKTKNAIDAEESKIACVNRVNSFIPVEIKALVESGDLIQWRKHPHTFFVDGVDKARIVWLEKKKQVAHKFTSQIGDKEQLSKFAKVYNALFKSLNGK